MVATHSNIVEAGSNAYMFNLQKRILSNGKERGGSISVRVHVTLFSPNKFAQRGLVKHALITPRKPRGGQGHTLPNLHS
jgi:hypothetical protein